MSRRVSIAHHESRGWDKEHSDAGPPGGNDEEGMTNSE